MEIVELKNLNIVNAKKYALMDGDKQIGYGYIKNCDINPIEIYVSEEYRSNGYGKFLFSKLVDIAERKGIVAFKFEIELSNYRMINIILNAGGKRLQHINGLCRIVLVLN